jgi:hypothetical protein
MNHPNHKKMDQHAPHYKRTFSIFLFKNVFFFFFTPLIKDVFRMKAGEKYTFPQKLSPVFPVFRVFVPFYSPQWGKFFLIFPAFSHIFPIGNEGENVFGGNSYFCFIFGSFSNKKMRIFQSFPHTSFYFSPE